MRLIKTTMCDERWRLAAFRSGRFPTIKGMKAAFLFFWRGFVIFLSSTVTFLSFQTVVEKFYKMF